MDRRRRLPFGADVLPGGGVHFRVWAPTRRTVEVALEGGPGARGRGAPVITPLAREPDGTFSGVVEQAADGTRYRYRLDGGDAFPDPASRYQPEGPHGPSQVVDPGRFEWTDGAWKGVSLRGQIVYELHVGTFTREGTWAAAADELPRLRDLGVTVVEMMPVAEFPGRFGWGYDGVDLYAPTRLYGTPDDLRRFVDRAHALGLGVLLDVVYNHLGPDGNYLAQYAPQFFTKQYANEWGEALNFDGEGSEQVRAFFASNAGYWVDEYHFDGLRLDATQQIFDDANGHEHVLAAVGRLVREKARGRATIVVAENEAQESALALSVERGGHALDGLWNDDWHHAVRVAVTGRREAYYTDYTGTPQEIVSAVKHGYLYQGQYFVHQKKRRGAPARGVRRHQFVTYISNHDQASNWARGARLITLTSPARYRAISALLLIAPGTPMLFMGQEYGATTPFVFFADHEPDLARRVHEGRTDFLAQFPTHATPASRATVADPADPATFELCKLDAAERARNPGIVELYSDLIRLRRSDPLLAGGDGEGLDGAVLGAEAFALRWFADDEADRLLVVNLGRDLDLLVAPEPLLAPPQGRRWRLRWSSEEPRYGGAGALSPEDEEGRWRLIGHATSFLVAE